MKKTFAGFGFGPIQSGLFAKEAADAAVFDEIVVSEVDAALVDAVRGNNNRYTVNIAWGDRVEAVTVEGVTLLNPAVPGDAMQLRDTLARATEIVTSLPSIDFYTIGGECSVAELIAGGLSSRVETSAVIYAAENNNYAAESLAQAVNHARSGGGSTRPVQFLNTVIGKMSQVVDGAEEINAYGLEPMVPGWSRAFLVESFNRILISRITLPGFVRGINVFEEKDDLLPFEEVKLYGHNAVHTMLGFMGYLYGVERLSDLCGQGELLELAQGSFVAEVGAALCIKYNKLDDPLFTTAGFNAYAADLMERIMNPYLADTVPRAIRDPMRKLGADDRIFGAIRVCLENGVVPECLACGALAGIHVLLAEGHCPDLCSRLDVRQSDNLTPADFVQLLEVLWQGSAVELDFVHEVAGLLAVSQSVVAQFIL